ncbi:paired amphipathic helix protein Sin3-like 2 isoform X2 [Eucalyptus grandis]|uniref:paired amphipathic helix protein Sin3-like 2 isoform X2 n=1 Tax=Eucalyptus grandis TaxID=71139 RepID=UPI00192EE4B5|nr:paired amphipathic helix protein Sin3-like 2 isoform X2 [Eucalyptus grandis]
MKRTRDDVYPGSQFKRPFGSSRGEYYGQSQVTGTGAMENGGGVVGGGSASQKLTTNDALTYLKEVKDMFQDQREKYDTFLEVMKDFKAQRTDTTGVIARVKELFKGHNKLILGFNTFLPKGFEISPDEDETPIKKNVEFEEAISFVNKIKKRFQNDEHVYKSFLDILNKYRKEHKDINEVYSEVENLFGDHQDLLEEFTKFLPDNSATASTHNFPYARNSFQRQHERSSATPTLRQMQIDKRARRDRIINAHAEHDINVDRPDLDDDKAMIKVQKDQRKRFEKDNRDRRNREVDDRESEHDTSRDFNSQRFPDKRKSARKVENYGMTSCEDRDALKSMYNQGFIFCEKVKERLCSSDDYQAFLKCLHMYSSDIIRKNDLQNLVRDLLGKHPDLMEEFNGFLERCENIDGFLAGIVSKRSLSADGHMSWTAKAEDKDKEHKRENDGAKDKERCKDKYMFKSIQELDLSNCQRCTPSYRLLPDDYPIPSVSQRSELGAQVLNDHWVSVTSGSEDYSFKHMRRNQYEESLFRCEDDRFELDMLLESVSSTAKRAEEVWNNINENINNLETPIPIENYFTALNLRCIERLYGDHGLDVMDILRKNPAVALPVMLIRLKQKQEEWTRCRSDFNKIWAEIYAKNHYKSLDHRSFYFKQQDSKNLSTKSLVAEIKELKEKKQKEDDVLLAIAAGSRQTIVPHLEFEYSDVKVLEDLYKLVRYSCEEVCSSKEQFNKVMRLWATFVEPMLGFSSRTPSSDGAEILGNAMCNITKCSASSRRGSDETSDADAAKANLLQSKLRNNVDENASSGLAGVSKAALLDRDASAKENNSLVSERADRDDVVSDTPHLSEKEPKDVDLSETVAASNVQVTANAQTRGCTPPLVSENSHERINVEAISGSCSSALPSHPKDTASKDHESKGIQDSVPLSEGNAVAKMSVHGILQDSVKISWNQVGTVEPSKFEKEEGELSPNEEFEEENLEVYAANSLTETRRHIDRQEGRSGNLNHVAGQDGGDNDADADDEDSENVSETGGDVSGSDSAGDACSHEEPEEEEDLERDEADGKSESEGEAEGAADAHSVGGDSNPLPLSERFLSSVKPLSKHVTTPLLNGGGKDSRLFYGNDNFYVLFRLHQILYERILSAKTSSLCAEMKRRTLKDSCSSDPYARFMSVLYKLLDGTLENAKFEDACRDIIGNHSYILFTLDKLIYKLVKQLQTVASEDMDNKLLQLYEYEKSRKQLIDAVYYENTRIFLHEENIYRLEFSSSPSRMSIQLMDSISEKPEVFAISIDPNFADYLYNDFLSVFPGKKKLHDTFLLRNKRKYVSPDESSALCMVMEGARIINGLECKIACNSSKISYVLDTEDLFFRPRWKKRRASSNTGFASSSHNLAKIQKFNRFLSSS